MPRVCCARGVSQKQSGEPHIKPEVLAPLHGQHFRPARLPVFLGQLRARQHAQIVAHVAGVLSDVAPAQVLHPQPSSQAFVQVNTTALMAKLDSTKA